MTKIDIISGFLGAGKTTLIKKLLEEGFKGEKVVLIENEFGEIGIDGGFLKDAGVEITEMNSGCICCSLVGDFETSLKEVLDKFSPDRIIIEPSGVGKLSDVIVAVKGVLEDGRTELNSLVAVADGTKCKMYMKNFGEFFNNQIESAKTIILSRTQKMDQKKLDACIAQIREHNENAAIITTPWDDITGKQILDTMEQKNSLAEEMLKEEEVCPSCGHVHHHDHDDHDCCGHDHDHHHHDHDDHDCCGHDHDHHHHDHDDHSCCGHDHDHHHHDHDGHDCCGHDHHHHHADEVFTSWGVETPHKFEEENVKAALEKLCNTEEYGIILRAKGMLPKEDGTWIYFDLVPGEYEMRQGSPEYTGRLCVIGTKLDEAGLQQLFGI